MIAAISDPRQVKYASTKKIAPSPTEYQLKKPSNALISPSSASTPRPTLMPPTMTKSQKAWRSAFFALSDAATSVAGTVAPCTGDGVEGQVGVDPTTAEGVLLCCGGLQAASCGGFQVTGACGGIDEIGWTGAIASVVAHMSHFLLPSGIAQPQRLQIAISLYRSAT